MTGSRKKVVIAVVVIAAVVAVGIIGFFQVRDMAQPGGPAVPDTIVLRLTDLENKVTASGNFASMDPVSVGTNSMGSEVAEVMAEEGDKVYMGDVLARLKTSNVERSISDAQTAVTELARGDRQKIEAAQRSVNDATADYEATDRQTADAVSRAQTAVANAESKWETEKKAVSNAKNNLDAAKKELADAEAAVPPDPDVVAEKTAALNAAKTGRDAAVAARDAAKSLLDQAKEALEAAKVQRENSLRAAGRQKAEAQAQLDSLYGVDSTRQGRSQIESLNEELENAAIVSPITGIVTRVMTEAGQSATGKMFMIEDTVSLQISANIAEFDVIKIEEGMAAHIRSNATGSEQYKGVVDFVAPVAADTNGNFEVRVLLTSDAGQLKPGMTATVEIVIAAKKDVFAVPIDAVVTKPDGSKAIYIYEPGSPMLISGGPVTTTGPGEEGGGSVTTTGPGEGPIMISGPGGGLEAGAGNQREIIVKTGMETDFYIEIISDELSEGMLIVADPMGRNVSASGGGPMMIGAPAGGMAVGGRPARGEGTVTVVAD